MCEVIGLMCEILAYELRMCVDIYACVFDFAGAAGEGRVIVCNSLDRE